MNQITSYLTFNGNCREAMDFYKDCLGGDLYIQTVGESPMADQMPPQMKNNIMHASLTHGGVILMGSDLCPERLNQGNTVSLLLDCNSEEEVRTIYNKLAAGGKASHPPANTFWGAYFGDLTDKYGFLWLLNFMPAVAEANPMETSK
ncbi:MAG TPA: VOC family protein [Chitinophagaceae bacterium]|nr:VOC family protein [Chitinophagaceae bacterium]